MRITACHNTKEPKRKQKKVGKILPMEWMLGPSLTHVRPMAGAGASASVAVSNGRATADPTNPMQSRGITST